MPGNEILGMQSAHTSKLLHTLDQLLNYSSSGEISSVNPPINVASSLVSTTASATQAAPLSVMTQIPHYVMDGWQSMVSSNSTTSARVFGTNPITGLTGQQGIYCLPGTIPQAPAMKAVIAQGTDLIPCYATSFVVNQSRTSLLPVCDASYNPYALTLYQGPAQSTSWWFSERAPTALSQLASHCWQAYSITAAKTYTAASIKIAENYAAFSTTVSETCSSLSTSVLETYSSLSTGVTATCASLAPSAEALTQYVPSTETVAQCLPSTGTLAQYIPSPSDALNALPSGHAVALYALIGGTAIFGGAAIAVTTLCLGNAALEAGKATLSWARDKYQQKNDATPRSNEDKKKVIKNPRYKPNA